MTKLTHVRVLILEDQEADAALMLREMKKEGFDVTATRVDTERAFCEQLSAFPPDVILADYKLSAYDGIAALAVAQQQCPGTPFILVSGVVGEDIAVECLQRGAADYVLKERLFRLGPAVRRALLNAERGRALQQSVAAAAAHEEQLQFVSDHAPVYLAHYGPDQRYKYVNQSFASLFGRTKSEIVGQHPRDVLGEMSYERAHRFMEAALAGQSSEHDFVFRKPAEPPRTFHARYSPQRDASGAVVGFIGAALEITERVRDITERKVAERALALQGAALNAAADAVVIADRNGNVEWANAAFTRLTGYTVEEATGKNPRDLVRSGVHERAFYDQMWATLLAGNVWRGQLTNRRKDGSFYPEDQTITPVRDATGAITHFIAIKRDLSDERRLQAQFLQAQKMESVGRLAGGVAHDFNNLLSVILCWTEIALSELPDPHPIRESLGEVLNAGHGAARLTKQLLAFSRQQMLESTVFSVHDLVAQVDKMLSRLVGEDITFTVRSDPAVGSVKMDSGQLEQVLMNLVVNARDAMPNGGTLAIETRRVVVDAAHPVSQGDTDTPPGNYVALSVRDSGVGMSDEARAHIFEPFFTTKAPGKGTGLGLATCYGIVKQAGGQIFVRSEVGIGTTFELLLPLFDKPRSETGRVASKTPSHGNEAILLVEDEASVRRAITRMLERQGYRVISAAGGDEALRLLETVTEPLHLLLTDVVLAGSMNGPSLAERVRALRPELKVLFVSGYTSDVTILHGLSEHSIAFLQKPFTAHALGRRVREVLDTN